MKRFVLFVTLFCLAPLSAVNAEESAEAAAKEAVKEAPAPSAPKKSEISEILDSMGYPELQVVPRASDRLALEAKTESVFTHWPVELAGLVTIASGLNAKGSQRTGMTNKEQQDADTLAGVAQVVGLGWVVGAAFMGAQRPYYHSLYTINKFPGKDDRSTLMRERLAEESMEKQARIWSVLTQAAVITCVAANVGVAYHSNENGIVTAGVAAILAFMPLMFEDHTEEVYEKQIEYKKKIYTLIKSAGLSYDQLHKNYTPTANLTWLF